MPPKPPKQGKPEEPKPPGEESLSNPGKTTPALDPGQPTPGPEPAASPDPNKTAPVPNEVPAQKSTRRPAKVPKNEGAPSETPAQKSTKESTKAPKTDPGPNGTPAQEPTKETAQSVKNDPGPTTVIYSQAQLVDPEVDKNKDVDDEVEDLAKQEREGDLSGEYGKRVFCKRHFNSLLPIILLFHIFGRFPFKISRLVDGTYEYTYKWYFPSAAYFLLSTLLMVGTLVLGCWNIFHIQLDLSIGTAQKSSLPYRIEHEHEALLVSRYFIPLIYVYASLLHGVITSIVLFCRRHYTAQFLTFWSKAVYTLHMDVSKKARAFAIRVIIYFLLFTAILALFTVFEVGPCSKTLPLVIGDLTFRLFIPETTWLLEANGLTKRLVRVFGSVTLVFTLYGSKVAVVLFTYHCKILRTAFAYWNGRMYAAILRGGLFSQTEEGRTTCRLLFKDHCVLMDLLEGTNQVFSFIIESYFGCQVFSLFFELYFLIRAAKTNNDRYEAAYPLKEDKAFFIRPNDWAPALVMFFSSVSILFFAAKNAAELSEEAMAGLEVLRRKTMLGRKSDEELYFTLSMFSSYTAYKKLEFFGGGYSYVNKDFMIGIVSAALSYFIILYQFQPIMDFSYAAEKDSATRELIGKFLIEIEGLEENHYESTTTKEDLYAGFRDS